MAERSSELVTVRPVSRDDLRDIARVHLAAFPDAALSQLGSGAVERYYEWQLTGPHDCNAVLACTSTKVLGFCFGGRFRGATRGFIRENLFYLGLRATISPRLWTHPDIAVRLRTIRRSLLPKAPTTPREQPSCFSILSIAVDPSSQRKGLGVRLLDAQEEAARTAGWTCMSLTVHPSNGQATAFYLSKGWSHVKSDSGWSGGMRKDFDLPHDRVPQTPLCE